ncbi:hypothetical protein [Pararobbsia alpina]|uniref:hypothetical protein n=1 Tax=Pararobbsia alpina TaxID=621374 RepID=UPI0039A5C830
MSDHASWTTPEPSPNRGDPPDFSRLESKQFEELTCSLLDKEAGIRTADLYHLDGQAQYGIDVIGWSEESGRVVVVSCKCYKSATPKQIADWSKDFLNHWETHWKTRGVQRFILAISAHVHESHLMDEVSKQHSRFQAIGIEYEVWGPRQFQEKLRPHRGVVSQFLDAYWADRICGVSTPSELAPAGISVLLEMASNQIAPLQVALADEVDGRLDGLKARLREERPGPIVSELKQVRDSATWSHLPSTTRAKCLRYLASAEIQSGDAESAGRLVAEADAISPNGGLALRALLYARKGEPEAALRILESTTEPEALELKVALLLEGGDLDTAKRELDQICEPLDGPRSIEFARLTAFLQLFSGDREGALRAIQRAESQAPRWLSVQHAGAVIRYAFALSPAVGPEFFTNPAPIARELVREDDTSQRELKYALQTFSSLATQRQSQSAISRDEIWALACECNIISQSKQAEQRCQELIHNKPAYPEAIGWAIARGYDFDRSRSIQALSASIENTPVDPNEVLACSWLLSLESRDEEAEALLRRHESDFQTEAQLAAYQARMRSWEGFDDVQHSSAHESQIAEERLLYVVAHCADEGPWDEVESLFKDIATKHPNSVSLLAASSRLAAASHWEFLARNAEHVLRFATASAVQIAIHAAYNTGNSARALELMSELGDVFPSGAMPRVLRQIQARAMADVGEPQEALKVAELLAFEADSPREKMLAAHIRLILGDVRGALPTIRKSLSANAIGAEDALRLSRLVAPEDKELATRLWKQAQMDGVPDELALAAHEQALRLGLQQEASVLGTQLARLANTPGSGTVVVTFEELRERIAAWSESRTNFIAAYLDGRAPFHVASAMAQLNLAEYYFLSTHSAKSDLFRSPLMLRHGARAADFETQVPLQAWNVYADITSLFLAHQLDILEALEQSVISITVPSTIQHQLLEFRAALEHQQPARSEMLRQIARALREGRIDLYRPTEDTSDQREKRADSRQVWRIVSSQAEIESASDEGFATSVREVFDGLRQNGKVDEATYARGIESLKSIDSDCGAIPPSGATLIFSSNSLELVAAASSLNAVLATYSVTVCSDFAAACNAELDNSERREKCASAVDNLRRHVADKLISGEYKTLPVYTPNDQHNDADIGLSESFRTGNLAPASGLFELLRCQPANDAVFICDDRYLSGYPSIGIAPLVGIYEVLRALRVSRQITDGEYFAKMFALRSSTAMFLPLEKDEVAFHLLGAPVFAGVVKETDALATLRRYVARAVLLEQHLKIGDFPAGQAGRPDETWVLLSLRRLVDDCLVTVWASKDLSESEATAKANWLWSNLLVERHLGFHPSIKGDIDGVRTYVALTICAAISTAFQLVAGASDERRRAFSNWLEDVVASRLDNDERLLRHVCEQLTLLILGLSFDELEQHEGQVATNITATYLRQAFLMFPKRIRERLESDDKIRPLLRINVISEVTIGPAHIERAAFFRAVEKATRFGKSSTHTRNGQPKAKFRRTDTGLSLRFEGKDYPIDDDMFALFRLAKNEDIKAVLLRHPEWFDREQSEREQLVNEILRLPDAQQRFAAVDASKRSSLWHRYGEIQQKLSTADGVPVASFALPAPTQLLNHLRFTGVGNGTFESKWESAAEAVLQDFGLQQCFLRFAALPIPLPEAFVREFGVASTDMRHSVLMGCADAASKSPTHFLHALSLLRAHSPTSVVAEAYQRIASHVLERWEVLGEALGALLTWMESSAQTQQEWREMDDTAQIVAFWLHASNLMVLLNEPAASPNQIAERFKRFRSALSPDGALGRLDLSRDAASPSAHTGVGLLYGGLNYVLRSAGDYDPLSDEQWKRVAAATRISDVINPWISSGRESMTNRTGSFLRFKHSVLPEPALVTSTYIDQFESRLIDLLESTPNSTIAWIHLHALSRVGVSESIAAEIPDLLQRADILKLSVQPEHPFYGCRGLAGCAALYGGPDTLEKIANQIVALADRFALQHKRNESAVELNSTDVRGKLLTELIEITLLLCRKNKVADGLTAFAELSSRLVQAWPPATKAMRGVLEQMCNDSLLEDNREVWRAYIHLRAQ